MDRSILSAKQCLPFLFLLLVFSTTVSYAGDPTEAPGTPSATPQFTPDFSETLLASQPVNDPPTGSPDTAFVVQVTLAPGASSNGEHAHEGWFVLHVETGAICYQQGNIDSDVRVLARTARTDPATDQSPCNKPVKAGCNGASGCFLEQGDVVYLPAGSTILQTDTSHHSYSNPAPSGNSTNPGGGTGVAVVTISGVWPGGNGAPGCGGGCW